MTFHRTTPAAEKFLAMPQNLILATIRKNGMPQLSPVWYVWRDDTFFISTTTTTAKWQNLLRDQRCSGIIDHPDGRYIHMAGTAELSTEEHPLEITREIVRKYKSDAEFEPYMHSIRKPHQRGIVRLQPERFITRELE
jgi:PPOX class probable F420-dependent enzyme